jgi:PAS domain S-box-containing protein
MSHANDAPAEIARLRERLAALEAELAATRQRALVSSSFDLVVEKAPIGIGIGTTDGTLVYGNPALRRMLHIESDMAGHSLASYIAEHDQPRVPEIMTSVQASGAWHGVLWHRRSNDETFPAQVAAFIVPIGPELSTGIASIIGDISEPMRAEQERARLHHELLAGQEATLRELATPLLPLNEDTIVMPLVGTIDSVRAQMVMETLLEGVANYQADTVILDITGVKVVDTQVADAIIRAARAVRLLGARVLLTGVSPAIAMTLVHLAADMHDIVTLSNLQAGIAYALDN